MIKILKIFTMNLDKGKKKSQNKIFRTQIIKMLQIIIKQQISIFI